MNTNNIYLDEIDQEILAKRVACREQINAPRIGDFVLFPTGELERFSHNWGDALQTSPSGSFYLQGDGEGSLSCGGLNPSTPRNELKLTNASLPGSFWFFHHNSAGAGRGVYFKILCRVYSTSAKYDGFLGQDFQSAEADALKKQLNQMLNTQNQGEVSGALAREIGTLLPLKVLQSVNGFYLGTADDDGPVSRESVEYWLSKDAAEKALLGTQGKDWTQRLEG